MLAFASENQENKVQIAKSEETITENNAENLIFVKIEEDEYTKTNKKTSKFIGVCYDKSKTRWTAQRRNKSERKNVVNGSYKDEETAAHASDTLARKLMKNGERNLKLNFPDDKSEVFPEKIKNSSRNFGVYYHEKK
jgi:hypothetical protein